MPGFGSGGFGGGGYGGSEAPIPLGGEGSESTASESIAFGEQLSVGEEVSLTETVTPSEEVAVSQALSVELSESISITDALPTLFDEAIYTVTESLLSRSFFTDKGPIVKPPLTLRTGTGVIFQTFETVGVLGFDFTGSEVGKFLRLTGSESNDGAYEVLAILGPHHAKLLARFILPDSYAGDVHWEVFDPRTGQIANEPKDVTVRVGGVLVVPDVVVGLKGQIVLPMEVLEGSPEAIEIDYFWISNPRVEIHRLNSMEFRLNAWNRDLGGPNSSGHHYRYNNVLVTPSEYVPDDLGATLEQPLLRELAYRAYERAYTAVLNDPTTLLFNSPIHKVGFPPASRTLEETSILYEAATLPETDLRHPWVRHGLGSVTTSAGLLVVTDDSAGTFPAGSPVFWTRAIDTTFEHVLSVAWRFAIDSVTATEGVWTGIAAGYSNESVVCIVGYLDDGGTKKIGFLRRGAEDAVEDVTSWTGGSNDEPVVFDWSILHSYRLFTDREGIVSLFVDGDVIATLRLMPDEAPFLEEVNAPFDEIQGVFFGSLSRPALSRSSWDFYRYLIQPLNALQISPSSFVAYEADDLPEFDASPWTPVGFHGTSTLFNSDSLLLDSTSATDIATSTRAGLMGGDFRGYVKIEPLLTAASQVVVDAQMQLLTHTHGIDPNGSMLAVDDGTRLLQLCFFAATEMPKLSYGGRSLPNEFSPFVWSSKGSQPAVMRGRILRLTDTSAVDGRVYFINDDSPAGSVSRVVSSSTDYILEIRLEVVSYTADGAGFVGASAQVFDGVRSVGILLQEIAGVCFVALHSDGVLRAQFEFDWRNGAHTYRVRKSTSGDLVSLFGDGALLGTLAYSLFETPAPGSIGVVSFGSSTARGGTVIPLGNVQSQSVVDWSYCNAWRVAPSPRRYMGLWKGVDPDALTGYHLPLKTAGSGASVVGNVLDDLLADFDAADVQPGDPLVVDSGSNVGVFEVATVVTSTKLTITSVWPSQPSAVGYRIVRETDWSEQHKYRLARDSTGAVSVFFDGEVVPSIVVDYDSLPTSGAGIVRVVSTGLPAVAFGSFSPEHLEQSLWGFVRYGMTSSAGGSRIVPPHQVLNQWNVMESPERLFTLIPHELTSFKSSSTGTTPQTDPDFLRRADVRAFTRLNEGTPLVPETQAFENRGSFVTHTPLAASDNPEDVLSGATFSVNDGETRTSFTVPEDVLYTSLQVIRSETGTADLLAPFDDEWNPHLGSIQYQGETCLEYVAGVLPEDDTTASTPWSLQSDDPDQVSAVMLDGALTYGTGSEGTRTAYFDNTPLPTAPSLQTEASFRLRLAQDSTLGIGDSQVRFGLSVPGMTVGIGFVTHPSGDRFVEIFDLGNGRVMGRATVDYLDGDYHEYRIVRNPSAGVVEVYVSPSER